MTKKYIRRSVYLFSLCLITFASPAQTKIGYISLNELMQAMPEAKKADSAIEEFKQALQQNFEELRKNFMDQSSLLNSKDSAIYTKGQLELKRKNLSELYQRLENYQAEASQQLEKKGAELIEPIQKKALQAIEAAAREGGYTCVFQKEKLAIYPLSDDLLLSAKKRLGIR